MIVIKSQAINAVFSLFSSSISTDSANPLMTQCGCCFCLWDSVGTFTLILFTGMQEFFQWTVNTFRPCFLLSGLL